MNKKMILPIGISIIGVAASITGIVLSNTKGDKRPDETVRQQEERRKPYHYMTYSGMAVTIVGLLMMRWRS